MPGTVLSAAATKAAADAYLKDDYTVHEITDSINREAESFGVARRSSKEVRGRQAIIPVILKGNRNSVGARNELDDVPAPGFQKFAVDGSGNRVPGKIGMRINTMRIALTEALIKAAETSAGAFEDSFTLEKENTTRDFANDLNRQHIAGDGTGRLCRIAGVGGAPTYQVDQPGGKVCWPAGSDPDGSKFLETGDVVAVYSAAGAFRGQDTITAIDTTLTPNTVTLAGAVAGTIVGDYLVKASVAGATGAEDDAYNAELEGMMAWIDDSSTIASINPATTGNERWKATVFNFTAAPIPLSEPILHQLMSTIKRKGGKDAATGLVHWTTHALENDYGTRVLMPDRRYSNTTTFNGGYTALTFAGKPIMTDKDVLPGHWLMVTMKKWYTYNQGGFYWFDRDHTLHRVGSKMGWEAVMLFIANCGTPRRNIHGLAKGLQEPYRVTEW